MAVDRQAAERRRLRFTLALLRGLGSFAFGAIAASRILHLEAVGITAAGVGALMALYSAVAGIAEVPSGALADRWGRRRTKLAASALLAASLAGLAVTDRWLLAAVAIVMLALGRALSSGAVEAWFVDEIGDPEDPDVLRGLANAEAAHNLGSALGALVGGLVPWAAGRWLDETDVFLPVFAVVAVALAVEIAAVIVRMVEQAPIVTTDRFETLAGTIAAGVRSTLATPPPRWALLAMVSMGGLNASLELLTPLTLTDALGADQAAPVFGAVIATSWIVGATTSTRAPKLEARAGSLAVATAVVLAAITAAALVALGSGWGFAVIAYLGFNILGGPLPPLLATIVHRHVDRAHRSTAISTLQLAFLFGATIGAAVVASSERGALVAMGLVAVVAVGGLARAGARGATTPVPGSVRATSHPEEDR